ncbi:MAG TPA: universal stress protein [Phycisphaerales bacterium]|nr:universal stress protein [Phycisphaerales bacterium]
MSDSILVPVDFSDVTEAVLAEAAAAAKAHGAKVWLIHVAAPEPSFVGYEVGPVFIREDVAEQLRQQHQKLQQYQQLLREQSVETTAMLVPGDPARKIPEEAARLQPRMIVLGSHGHGALHQLLAGSVCQAVLKQRLCPVLVVPAPAKK